MKYFRNYFSILIMMLFVVSCQDFETDLNVENVQNPDDARLSEASAGTIFQNWFVAVHQYNTPGLALHTMSDTQSCSWGNQGMRDLSSEPRVAFNNTSSYSYQVINSAYFNALYSVLADANALTKAIKDGKAFETPDQHAMIGKLGQALTIGNLALVYDKVWLADENGQIGTEPANYKDAMTHALLKLDEAIAIAKTKNVSLPNTWVSGGSASTNAKLVQFMNSMGARFIVCNVRNSAQKATINWNRVLTYANNGLTSDFDILTDDDTWYTEVPHLYLTYKPWSARTDMRVVNMMDPSMPDYWTNFVSLPESTYTLGVVDQRLKTDYEYQSTNAFIAARGLYHYSNYRYKKLDNFLSTYKERVIELSKSENDMYKAEALAFTNNLPGAATVINAGTRVTRGKLSPVTADLASIKKAIHHERLVEFSFTGMGLPFFEMRKENLLQKGTMLHFPIPGKALESIAAPYYTFGGTQGVAGEDYSNGGWR